MKKLVFLMMLLVSFTASAKDESYWSNVYNEVKEAFIYDVDAEKLVIDLLKGLNKVDKSLRVGNDSSRITLYYRGKVVKVLRKPENRGDLPSWGNVTKQMIDAAVDASPLASEVDFNIENIVAPEMVRSLDKDSKFYKSIDDISEDQRPLGRTFAARKEGKSLYIRILMFNKQTLTEIKNALSSNTDYEALIFDLRGCPGGMMGMSIDVADLFLSEGIIASTRGKEVNKEVFYNAKSEDDIKIVRPVFIFVDGDTASAAEIFAAAMQEQGLAKIIGTQTKGKGTMQKLIGLTNGGVLAITNGFFMTPSGIELNEKGITPDICTFEMPETKDIANLIKEQNGKCMRESRVDSELEFKVVDFLIAQ